MCRCYYLVLFFLFSDNLCAQTTFKSGWNTYATGSVTHEYTYNFNLNDSIRLFLVDSSLILTSTDSLVTMVINYPNHDNSIYKTTTYLNNKKQIIKIEEYKDEALQVTKEWRYDEKNRRNCHTEDNKVTGNNFKKYYDYSIDKKSGETVVTESSYFNGRIEFYTKSYYDKNNVKLKEVRYNDNNKDIVHIESYTYGENGKVKERSVFFPEWKVTKKFEEKEGSQLPKCSKGMPMGTAEKVSLHTRIAFMKRIITKNQALFSDKECHDFEYKFSNFSNCDIVVASTNVNNARRAIFRFKEKPL